jgi:AcrR family transcriptional regulator
MPSTGATLGLRERKKLDTHRALTSAAVELVAARGLEHVTIDDISAAVGVSSRTFFNYFASKEDAVVIAYPDHVERAEELAERLLAAPADYSPMAALALAFQPEIDRIEADRESWLTRISLIERYPELIFRMVSIGMKSDQTAIEAMGRRTGLDPQDDPYPRLVCAVASGVVSATVHRWYSLDGRQPLGELLDTAFDVVAHGLPLPPHAFTG